MSWIDHTAAQDEAATVAEILSRAQASEGSLDAVFQVQSKNAAALASCTQLYENLLHGDSGLTRADREAIAVVVSASNNSTYCVARHAEALARYETDNTRLKNILSGFRFLEMTDRSARMLSYAAKLTATPAAVTRADIDRLLETGFSERDVLDINLITSFFNFINRVALGLGVRLDPDTPFQITAASDR